MVYFSTVIAIYWLSYNCKSSRTNLHHNTKLGIIAEVTLSCMSDICLCLVGVRMLVKGVYHGVQNMHIFFYCSSMN